MQNGQLEFFHGEEAAELCPTTLRFLKFVEKFNAFGSATITTTFPDPAIEIPVYINEFWTAKQRAAHSLHEISYRACFKPQLPAFFINQLTQPGSVIYDPFMGRGTTVLESALLDRIPLGCDVNPLSSILVKPRLNPPSLGQIEQRLNEIDLAENNEIEDEQLLTFYHPETLSEIYALRAYLKPRELHGTSDNVDDWIRMIATNRLTGHSPGFFSVYTLPPNQATSIKAQQRINERRNQIPPERNVKAIINKKSKSLLKDIDQIDQTKLRKTLNKSRLLTSSCDNTPEIQDASVDLIITSPPFLDIVNYQGDNWLRCWFNHIDPKNVSLWNIRNPDTWIEVMTKVFLELKRILKPGGYIAFEVGEIRGGKIRMETLAAPAAIAAGLIPIFVLINDQEFTKTANCWGVSNQSKGTNTNRILLLQKGT